MDGKSKIINQKKKKNRRAGDDKVKKIKSLLIGAGVAIGSIIPSLAQVVKPEKCAGTCGTCGFPCINEAVGLAGIGIIIVFYKKIKEKFWKGKIS